MGGKDAKETTAEEEIAAKEAPEKGEEGKATTNSTQTAARGSHIEP